MADFPILAVWLEPLFANKVAVGGEGPATSEEADEVGCELSSFHLKPVRFAFLEFAPVGELENKFLCEIALNPLSAIFADLDTVDRPLLLWG